MLTSQWKHFALIQHLQLKLATADTSANYDTSHLNQGPNISVHYKLWLRIAHVMSILS